MQLKDELAKLKSESLDAIIDAASTEALEDIRVGYLGRKGRLTQMLKAIGRLPAAERPQAGQLANEVRQAIETELEKRRIELSATDKEAQLSSEAVDITLTGRRPVFGQAHVLTQVIDEIIGIFVGLGYKVAEGPEAELDWFNFEALNMPPDHPARSLQDTFYLKSQKSQPEVLLRTHTSPVQIRVMEQQPPPVYIICPGRVYRRDVPDPSHSPIFHQVEGLVVDEGITFADLRGTLEAFVHQMFGADRRVRLRPHFFAFTEPSAEVDVSCIVCGGKGCRVCGGNGWLEILGCGMVDPNVFANVGYDPEKNVGFAFGMGVERIAMLKYGINDIRSFYENDLRFLKQF